VAGGDLIIGVGEGVASLESAPAGWRITVSDRAPRSEAGA
jgi:hypothetical protein